MLTTQNSPDYTQVRTFLEMCNSLDAIAVRLCFLENHARFGFKSFAYFDPKLELNVNLADVIKDRNLSDIDAWNYCKDKSRDGKVLTISDSFVS